MQQFKWINILKGFAMERVTWCLVLAVGLLHYC